MKKIFLTAVTLLMASSAWASLPEGNFSIDVFTLYSNGQGAYCRQDAFDGGARQLSQRDLRTFDLMQDQGDCNPRYGYAEGPFSYRGRSYFASKQGNFCEYRQFNRQLRTARAHEATKVFKGGNHGFCGG